MNTSSSQRTRKIRQNWKRHFTPCVGFFMSPSSACGNTKQKEKQSQNTRKTQRIMLTQIESWDPCQVIYFFGQEWTNRLDIYNCIYRFCHYPLCSILMNEKYSVSDYTSEIVLCHRTCTMHFLDHTMINWFDTEKTSGFPDVPGRCQIGDVLVARNKTRPAIIS